MFSKSKDVAPPAPPAQMQPKRPGRSAAPSIISGDLVVNGTLTSTGDIQIDGRVEGDIQSSGLVIGDKAFIHGELKAEDVTVRGRVQGSIRARKVLLCATAHVEGNILHEAFAVETGAFFEGNCRHHDNPLSDDAVPRKTAEFTRAAVPAAAQPAPMTAMRPGDPPRPAATVAPLKSGA